MYMVYQKTLKKTPFGPIVILWSKLNDVPKIVKIFLSNPEISAEDQVFRRYNNLEKSSCSQIDVISEDICSFLDGENINFSGDILNLDICSPFQRMVLKAECIVPRGCVTTYQLLAFYLGKEKGARAVGNALANNPFPIIIPCHRTIRSNMTLGGFQGGLDMKKTLLENEGVNFDCDGKVNGSPFDYGKSKLIDLD